MSTAASIISKTLAVAGALGNIPPQNRQVSLELYVATTKRLKLDVWQRDICARLEKAFWIANADKFHFIEINYGMGVPYYVAPSGLRINKEEFDKGRNLGTRAAIHAPPQFGKSIIISQCYPAWILGYDPLHRFRLATYSVLHSARFSVAVKNLLYSPEHQAFFPNPDGHIPRKCKAVEWSTNARIRHSDGQSSFSALGLQSGFTGTGADTLLMDDPYKGAEEALSEVIRDKTWRFFTDTAEPRMSDRSNVFIMFHRYHQDDMGGRAIATGDFLLWRYAAQADGDYVDEETGLVFPDPLGRAVGVYLSPRFGELYYLRQKKNEQVWYSQFQGIPSAKTGNFFNISNLRTISRADLPRMIHKVRAWDNAATQGGGAFTAGVLMGIDAAENVYIFDVVREQVDTAGREQLQYETAEKDGKLTEIHAPEDPGSAGKDVAFNFEQFFSKEGYKVTITKAGAGEDASNARVFNRSKTMRALSFAKAVGYKQVFIVLNEDGSVPAWFIEYKKELRYFPASTYKDQVDASSDAYNHLIRLFHRGLVIKSANNANLLHRTLFKKKFQCEKVHQHWEVVCAVRLAPDSSKPSGYCITTRAAENAYVGEMVFIVAARRMYVDDPLQVLLALREDLEQHCALGARHPSVIWLNKGAGDMFQVAAQKYDMHVVEFLDEATAGIPETNWYFQTNGKPSPFYPVLEAPHAYCLVDDEQFEDRNVTDERGLMSLRQDWYSWSYTDKGEVQPYGGITLDCVRMTLYKFALSATALTNEEKRLAKLPPALQPAAVRAKLGTPDFVETLFAQEHALNVIKAEEAHEREEKFRTAHQTGLHVGARAVTRRYRRGG